MIIIMFISVVLLQRPLIQNLRHFSNLMTYLKYVEERKCLNLNKCMHVYYCSYYFINT